MDKPNQFKSSNFYMAQGDICHILIKGESGTIPLIHLMGVESGDMPEDATGVGLQDYDGNQYTEITIGSQKWLVENLIVTSYADGTPIPNVTLAVDWAAEDGTVGHDGAYCWYDNDIIANVDYGILYNWHAVNNAHGLVYLTRDGVQEAGWRVPTKEDWEVLSMYLGGDSVAGKKLKETGLEHWDTPNDWIGTTNETGFTALGSGRRFQTGSFSLLRALGFFWTGTEYDADESYDAYLSYNNSFIYITDGDKRVGKAIRLVKPFAQPTIAMTTVINGTFEITLGGSGCIAINWGYGNVSNEVLTGENTYSHPYTGGGTITITGIENITSISAVGQELTTCVIPDTAINLTFISLITNNISAFETHAEWTALSVFEIANNPVTSLILHEAWINITALSISGLSITEITTYATWVNLVSIHCENNAISSFVAHDTWVSLNVLLLDGCNLTSFTTYNTWTVMDLFYINDNDLTTLEVHEEWVLLNLFDASGNAIASATDINNILIELDTMGMASGYVNLSGGTNTAPTGAGITAKDNLITAGVTVTTN